MNSRLTNLFNDCILIEDDDEEVENIKDDNLENDDIQEIEPQQQ